MRTAAVAFLLALSASLLLTPLVRRLALRLGALDHAHSSRKLHGRPVARLGGLAIVGGFFAPLLALLAADSGVGTLFYENHRAALGLFAGGLAIALLGVYDDLRGANAWKKLTVQFGVAALVYALGYRIDVISNPFGAPIELGYLALPFTMLWIAGVVNAMNLIDGLDGLAGGVAFVALAATFVFAVAQGRPLMMLTTAALSGAVLGFLRYNVSPASIFMGDTGSMFLGFVLAVTSIRTHYKATTTVALVIPIVVLGLPIADTLLSMARRLLRGAPLFQADRGHIHHRLVALGFTQRQAMMALCGTSLLLGIAAMALSVASGIEAAAVLLLVAVGCSLGLRRLGYLRLDRAAQVREDRRKNLEVRAGMRGIGLALRQAASVGDVWDGVRRAGVLLSAQSVGLWLAQREGEGTTKVHFTTDFDGSGETTFRSHHDLAGESPEQGALELGWSDGRGAIDRDTEIAIEQLCELVLAAAGRIQRLDERAVPAALPAQAARAQAAPAFLEQAPARVVNLRR